MSKVIGISLTSDKKINPPVEYGDIIIFESPNRPLPSNPLLELKQKRELKMWHCDIHGDDFDMEGDDGPYCPSCFDEWHEIVEEDEDGEEINEG